MFLEKGATLEKKVRFGTRKKGAKLGKKTSPEKGEKLGKKRGEFAC